MKKGFCLTTIPRVFRLLDKLGIGQGPCPWPIVFVHSIICISLILSPYITKNLRKRKGCARNLSDLCYKLELKIYATIKMHIPNKLEQQIATFGTGEVWGIRHLRALSWRQLILGRDTIRITAGPLWDPECKRSFPWADPWVRKPPSVRIHLWCTSPSITWLFLSMWNESSRTTKCRTKMPNFAGSKLGCWSVPGRVNVIMTLFIDEFHRIPMLSPTAVEAMKPIRKSATMAFE